MRQSPENISALASYCTGIRELTLGYAPAIEGSNLWENIGNTLEKLQLTLTGTVQGVLPKIQKYCQRLKDVDVTASGPGATGLLMQDN